MMRYRTPIFFFIVVFGALLLAPVVFAKDPKPTIRYPEMKAKYVSQSSPDPIIMNAGDTKVVTFKFKNIGTQTWNSLAQHPNGYRHVSAYTMEPRDRASVFRGGNWISKNQTGSITKDTDPGQIAELQIELQAPQKPGEYTEDFYLAAEDYSWIEGGYFFIKIKVVDRQQTTDNRQEKKVEQGSVFDPSSSRGDSMEPGARPTTSTSRNYQAKRIFQSTKSVEAKGGEAVSLALAFQNTGPQQWSKYQIIVRGVLSSAADAEIPSFADTQWQSQTIVLAKDQTVAQFDQLRERFQFRAPPKKGTYTASFHLQADDEVFDDVAGHVSVTVTEDAPAHYQAPHIAEGPKEEFMPRLASEPRIRVGVWKPESFVQFRSYEDDYDIYDGGNLVGRLPKKQMAVLKTDGADYVLTATGIEFRSREYIRLMPVNNPHAVFVLHNFERLVSWKGPVNFNGYRGGLEYRKTQDEQTVYVINDLLMEDYVKGIAENSNGSPEEYLKAQSVAQRTYAYYIKEHSDKHDTRNFDVVAHTGDQLYLGYESEKLMPRFVAAAQATRGYMVTYDTDIVITPYFARTACKTKGWHEVWGGAVRPWLVSVKTNYDCQRGLSALGHLVGMSQIDASLRAEKERLNFKELLAYYYTGTKAERIYE